VGNYFAVPIFVAIPLVFFAESRIMRTMRWPTSSTANQNPIYTLTGTLARRLVIYSRHPINIPDTLSQNQTRQAQAD